jgi:hypothetical protein
MNKGIRGETSPLILPSPVFQFVIRTADEEELSDVPNKSRFLGKK